MRDLEGSSEGSNEGWEVEVGEGGLQTKEAKADVSLTEFSSFFLRLKLVTEKGTYKDDSSTRRMSLLRSDESHL